MNKNNFNGSIKSLVTAIFISAIILGYVNKNSNGFLAMNFELAVVMAVIVFAFFLICFLIIRLITFCIENEQIYPTVFFRILLPFISISLVSLITYGFIYIEPFGETRDFIMILENFVKKIVPLIAISSIIMGLFLSIGVLKQVTKERKLLFNNLKFLLGIVIISIITISMFYYVNKIKQPDKVPYYKNLAENVTSSNYEIKLLLEAPQYHYVSEPYFIENKKEIIVNTVYADSNKFPPLYMSYKIDDTGEIINTLNESELNINKDYEPYIFQDGFIRDYDSINVFTWVFDNKKEKQRYKDVNFSKDWKIKTLLQKNKSIKMVRFFKTNKLQCENSKVILFDGTKYYNLTIGTDILKIKIDSIYSNINDNCKEKK